MNQEAKQPFAVDGFRLEITQDGSPTLLLEATGESMHHSGGAATETWYVYGQALFTALSAMQIRKTGPFKVCSVGLGLGYIEMLWALLQQQNNDVQGTLDSFETVETLKRRFVQWFSSEDVASSIYQDVFEKIIAKKPLAVPCENKNPGPFLFQSWRQQNLRLNADVTEYQQPQKWNMICFDAFSKKTSETLWTEEFLLNFLNQHAAEDCVFATYAATTGLKRVLLQQQFQLIPRAGFSGKRECTLAVRGLFKSDFETFQTF